VGCCAITGNDRAIMNSKKLLVRKFISLLFFSLEPFAKPQKRV